MTNVSKRLRIWRGVLRQRDRVNALGHSMRVCAKGKVGGKAFRFLFTCARCLQTKHRPSHLSRWKFRCVPEEGLAAARSRQFKRRTKLYLQLHRSHRRKLCDIWQLSPEERQKLAKQARLAPKRGPENQWIRDVTMDGDVEPNPGPSSSSPTSTRASTFRQWSVNLGGSVHLFEALDVLANTRGAERPCAVSFLECRTRPADQAAATRRLQRMGFTAFWVRMADGCGRVACAPRWLPRSLAASCTHGRATAVTS